MNIPQEIQNFKEMVESGKEINKDSCRVMLEINLTLEVLLRAALMRIDYYEEQEKEANLKQ